MNKLLIVKQGYHKMNHSLDLSADKIQVVRSSSGLVKIKYPHRRGIYQNFGHCICTRKACKEAIRGMGRARTLTNYPAEREPGRD